MSNNSMEYFELDLDIYNNIFKKSPRVKENLQNYRDIIGTFEKLSEDVYLSFFKAKPVIKRIEEINPIYRLNNIIIGKLFDTDEFETLRYSSSLKYFDSLLIADLFGHELVNNFKQLSKDSKEFGDELEKHEGNCQEYEIAEKELEYLYRRLSKDKDSELGEEIKRVRKSLMKLENGIDNSLKIIEDIITKDNMIFKSVSNASKEFFHISNTIKTWGLDDGILTPTSYEEKVEISLKLRQLKKVREISEMAGRFKASASQLQKRKTKEEGQEICGVQLGNEIHKSLPSEKLLLARKETKKSFYKKYTQKELLSYKYKNNRAKSKGPIICCVDTSSSMEGELEIWAKSIAIALLDISIKQRREFVAILFSNKVYEVIEFNKMKMEPSKLYQLATFFYGSGTNFVEPLKECIKLINSAKYKYSDIVFITDGEAPLDEEFIEEFNVVKEKKQFRMITVNVSNKICSTTIEKSCQLIQFTWLHFHLIKFYYLINFI